MEINNNNSLYLHHKCEDKRDKNDNEMQCENKISQSVTRVADGLVREKIMETSPKEIVVIKEIKMEQDEIKSVEITLKNDSDECQQASNEIMTQLPDKVPKIAENLPNESAEKIINNEELITSDSERLEKEKLEGEVNRKSMMTGEVQLEVSLINEQKTEMTQSNGESERFVYWDILYCLVEKYREALNGHFRGI